MRIDNDLPGSRALVIDGNVTSRSVLVGYLREFGVGSVRHVGRLRDARELLEGDPFDIVLCDYYFDHEEATGQDLLDELRRESLLPFSTVFVMVTGEASYAKVSEAAETALDSYLIKPYTGTSLFERLTEARRRKRILKPIFAALETNDLQSAAALCLQRFAARQDYWLYAARIGAEICLKLGQPDHARTLYEAVVKAKALPWGRLGIARAQAAAGQLAPARRTLEGLIQDLPDHADAYDVLGQVQLEQGELGQALQTSRKALSLTPESVTRLQQAGMLAFYRGDTAEALRCLEQACAIGVRSKMFDPMVLVLLALLRFDARDGKGLQQAQWHLQRRADRAPKELRTHRMLRIVDAILLQFDRRNAEAAAAAHALTAEAELPDFDIDSACGLIGLWARLAGLKLDVDEALPPVQRISRRYCVSHASCEMLLACAAGQPQVVETIRESHASIGSAAEQAMAHALQGHPRRAVESLLQLGRESYNAKLIELAGLVAQRHRERIDDAEELAAAASELHQRYCKTSANRHDGRRAPGGLKLRA